MRYRTEAEPLETAKIAAGKGLLMQAVTIASASVRTGKIMLQSIAGMICSDDFAGA
jgi:hypothetical protein